MLRAAVRLLSIALVCAVLVASTADAFEFTFVRSPFPELGVGDNPEMRPRCLCADGSRPGVGEVIYLDLYLDTQGQSDIQLVSLSLTYTEDALRFRPDLSSVNDYYPLYAPRQGKGQPPTWLEPAGPGITAWTGTGTPSGLAQVNFDFIEANLGGTVATATNLWLGRAAFEGLGGFDIITAGWDYGGNVFATETDGAWEVGPPVQFVWVPEPSTALLVGAGLALLARRRRSF